MLRRMKSHSGDADRTLVVGLGNPGKKYARTRHNVGTEAVEELAHRIGAGFKVGRDRARVIEARIGDHSVVVAVPTTYMNESGEAVGALCRRFKIAPARVVVVHDELDLEPGVVRVKFGGGLAGHNGLKSISQHLRSDDYARVRIGVGKPQSKEQGANFVLASVPADERRTLDVSVALAADAVERILSAGLEAAMQEFNAR
jgi:PTH1 family peptidyl-tRNA hydrolase